MESQNNIQDEAYKKRNIQKAIIIKGYKLNYKEPSLKYNIYRYRCRKKGCKYFFINSDKIIKPFFLHL